MFIPFKIRKDTIRRLSWYDFDTAGMLAHVESHINAESIKQALIDGTSLQEDWFPSEAYDSLFDVFISHSHADEYVVKQLAGYLKNEFGLRCFVDSIYWGYIGKLQKDLDDWYSAVVRDGRNVYDYQTSNFMAANVHIMLSTALLKMMDACECLLFVDSDNSLKYHKGQVQTPSPWIYEEMSFSKRIRVNIPHRHKNNFRLLINESRDESSIRMICFSQTEPQKVNFTYNVDMRDFEELKLSDFSTANGLKGKAVLDKWYAKYDATTKVVKRVLE